jgi:hypothetical protein
MVRGMMVVMIGASIWVLCSTKPGRAVDECKKCYCQEVEAYKVTGSGIIYGLREPVPGNPGYTRIVNHSPTTAFQVSIRSSTCPADPVSPTGVSYDKYSYDSAAPQCAGGATGDNLHMTDPVGPTTTKQTVEQRVCKTPPPGEG